MSITMDAPAQLDSLRARLRTADTVEQVRALIPDIQRTEDVVRSVLLVEAVRSLRELDYAAFLDTALDLSLAPGGGEVYMIRDLLAHSLEIQPEENRLSVAARLLEELQDLSRPERLKSALVTIAAIGYRFEPLASRIAALAGIGGQALVYADLQDTALLTLVELGYPDEEALVTRIEQRLKERPRRLLVQAAALLRSLQLLPALRAVAANTGSHEWSIPGNVTGNEAGELLTILPVAMAAIADTHPDQADVIWSAIYPLRDVGIFFGKTLNLASNGIQLVDSPAAADFLLEQIQGEDDPRTREKGSGTVSLHYHPYLRLQELARPRQLEGMRAPRWRSHPGILRSLHSDACLNTGWESPWRALTGVLKEQCWQAILCLGMPDLTSWIVEAMNDDSRYIVSDLCEIGGFLQAEETVPKLRTHLLDAGLPATSQQMGGVVAILRHASMRALGLIGTPAAFAALRDAFLPEESRVPLDFATALANASLALKTAHPLVELLTSCGSAGPMWKACAAAVEMLTAADPRLVTPFRDSILAVIRDQTRRTPATRRDGVEYLLSTLGFLVSRNEDVALLRQWASEEPNTVSALRAKEALARWKSLPGFDDLVRSLGLEEAEGGWRTARAPSFQEAFVIALLYQHQPEQFNGAMVDIIRKSDYAEVAQVLWAIHSMPAGGVAEGIIAALSERAQRDRSLLPLILDTLSAIARLFFVKRYTYEACSHWTAPERELVNSQLRRFTTGDETTDLALETLSRFLTDRAIAVRRSAARALGEIREPRLQQEVERLWSQQGAFERMCSVEAAAWLRDENGYLRIYAGALTDREAPVRNAAETTRRGRQSRTWARQYVDILFAHPEDKVIDVWHYGQALLWTGDDDTLSQLRKSSQDPLFPPPKRAWFVWLAEALDKKWNDRQQERQDQSVEDE